MNSNLANAIKKSKTIGIIASIIMVLGGIAVVSMPVASEFVILWTLLGVMLVNGIFRICRYCILPKEERNGWMLADGIVSTIIAVLVFFPLFKTPVISSIIAIRTLGYFFGFYEIFVGITQLCSSGTAKSTGWAIFLGIVNIICGLVITVYPFIASTYMNLFLGFYAIVFGVIMFIECLCMKKDEE